MKAMLFVTAAVVFAVGCSGRSFAADDAKSAPSAAAAEPSNTSGKPSAPSGKPSAASDKPTPCVPTQKDPNRHAAFLKDKDAALKNGPVQLVFIGDSITDAWRGGPQNQIYKQRWGRYNPLNLGISGDKTEHVLWRIENGELDGLAQGAKLVVMMIGTNNLGNPPKSTPEDTAEGVKCLVKAVREKLPNARLLLLGVFPRGKSPTDPYRAQIKTINDAIATLDDGKQVKYLDLADTFLDEQGELPADVMPDQLHPNEKGYAMWAEAMGPVIEEMIK